MCLKFHKRTAVSLVCFFLLYFLNSKLRSRSLGPLRLIKFLFEGNFHSRDIQFLQIVLFTYARHISAQETRLFSIP
jgi:hypothetical protein